MDTVILRNFWASCYEILESNLRNIVPQKVDASLTTFSSSMLLMFLKIFIRNTVCFPI